MSDENKNAVYIDVCSSESDYSLEYLLKEALSDQIVFFNVKIGNHLRAWKNARRGGRLTYYIDNIAICSGEIIYFKKRAFRPLWRPDHEYYKTFVDLAQILCSHKYDQNWIDEMVHVGIDAIDKKRWLFVAFAIVEPMMVFTTNKEILEDKIKLQDTASQELEHMVSVAYGDVL